MAQPKSPKPEKKAPKLPRLPSNARITKRPLLRPPIPSPFASSASPKVVYISAKTPFISAVNRVRKLLELIDKRTIGQVKLGDGRKGEQTLRTLEEASQSSEKESEEVILKATGRAIEKALGLGVFFQGQGDVRVRLRTGSVGTVDDIIVDENKTQRKQTKGKSKMEKGLGDMADADGNAEEHHDDVNDTTKNIEADDVDLPETQIRKLSVLEIGIGLK